MQRFLASLCLILATALFSRAEDPAPLQPELEIPEPEGMVPKTFPFQHDDPIVAVAWAPDGMRLVACDEGGTIRIWQSSGRRLKSWEDTNRPAGSSPFAVAWSPDDELIVTGIENEVAVWNASTGAEIRRLRCRQRVVSLAFLPDSRKLVIAGIDGELKLADLAGTADPADLPSPAAQIRMIVVSADGKKLAVAGQAPQVSILDLPGGEARMTFGPGEELAARWVAWKELDSSLFADTPHLGLGEIDATSGQQTGGFSLDWLDSMSAAASPKSGQFIVGISCLGHTFCHRAKSQNVEWSFDLPEPACKWVSISPDGKRVALPWGPRAIAIAATDDGRLLAGKSLSELPQRVAWSRDGKTVFSTRGTCEVHAFDSTTGRRLRGYIAPGYRNLGLVSRDDGALLAVTRGGAWLRVTDLTTSHDLVREVDSMSSPFAAIAWDGSTFAWKSAGEKIQIQGWRGGKFTWGSRPHKIRLRDLMTGEELPSIEPLTSLIDSPLLDARSKDESVFASLSPKGDFVLQVDRWGGKTIWTDTATGRVARQASVGQRNSRFLTAASSSPDGSWTAILSEYDCGIVATGNSFPLGLEITRPWTACAFSPDSRLFAILFDGSLHVYDPAAPGTSVRLGSAGNDVAFAWSPDATRIATLSEHGVTRIWKTPATAHGTQKQSEPIHDWGDLACQRADRALAAARRLEGAGPEAVALLRDKFAEKENPAHIADLVQRLRKEDASSRDAAREELAWMGVQAETALATEVSRVEAGAYRNELEGLLCQAESRVGPSPQNLRRQRAMQVLEGIGSAEALDALRHLSGESPSLRERADADGAVRRVEMKAAR